ncbi:hypothetical protein B5S32_g5809 [[Candida] boidinii]|nr:hypothetical protein B5S32_g5809 [[Candida] boidinii]
MLGKARRSNAVPFSKDKHTEHIPFAKVYSDVCQVLPDTNTATKTPRYFVSFRCAYTSYTTIYHVYNKSDVKDKLYEYIKWVENQFSDKGYKIKILYTDNGGEFVNTDIKQIATDYGIELHTTTPHTPASNGNAERLNLTILNDVRTMLFAADLPSRFWVEASSYSVFLRNQMYNDRLKSSPNQFLGYNTLSAKHIHTFGCACTMTILPYPSNEKIDTRATVGIYLGYSPTTYGHKVFLPIKPGDYTSPGSFEDSQHVRVVV